MVFCFYFAINLLIWDQCVFAIEPMLNVLSIYTSKHCFTRFHQCEYRWNECDFVWRKIVNKLSQTVWWVTKKPDYDMAACLYIGRQKILDYALIYVSQHTALSEWFIRILRKDNHLFRRFYRRNVLLAVKWVDPKRSMLVMYVIFVIGTENEYKNRIRPLISNISDLKFMSFGSSSIMDFKVYAACLLVACQVSERIDLLVHWFISKTLQILLTIFRLIIDRLNIVRLIHEQKLFKIFSEIRNKFEFNYST